MDFLVVCTVALLAGALTLITGFGLGTLLMPAFAAFFPPEVAVGATAVVHLANSLFKLATIGRWAKWTIVWAFGIPAIAGAAVGAALLAGAANMPTLARYSLGPIDAVVTPVGLLVGLLIIAFAFLETWDRFAKRELDPRHLTWGGLVSGFFGGLSGHQGALRTVFLVKAGLEPKQFAGTGSTISAMVDITRLVVYALGASLLARNFGAAGGVSWWLIAAACLAAFTGSALGSLLITKVTMTHIRKVVAVALGILGVLVAGGVL